MNVRSLWQHSGLVLTSALSLSLMFGCGDEAVQDGGTDSGPIVDGGPADAGTDAGPVCAGVGKNCFQTSECCAPFVCDQNTNKCKVTAVDAGGNDGGCSKGGDPCVTYADCCAGLGLACNTPADGGAAGALVCGLNTTEPTAKCVIDGNPCGDGGACCSGNCISGTCVAWPACGQQFPVGTCSSTAASCANDFECCTNNVCDGGTCGQVCGKLLDDCSGALAATDTCCSAQGFVCEPIGYGGSVGTINQCIPVKPAGPGMIDPTPCGPPGSAVECELGTTCVVTGTVDPCAQSGFVCTSTQLFVGGQPYSTCQFPGQFGTCVVGGPACQPIANSSATNLQCLNLQAAGGNLCLQPCVTASDCVDALNGCYAAGDGKACITDFGPNVNTTCTKAYTTCNSSGTNDGLCVEFGVGNGQNALICVQEATDGGGVGSCCGGGNRQSGNNCAYPNLCNGGLCAQVCDPNPPAGADAGFPCDQTNGPQYCFFPGIATAGDVTGTCTPPCDALNLGDAGSCPAPTGTNPAQTCTPAFVFDQSADPTVSDTTIGVCSAASASNVKILDTGAICNFPNSTCKEGSVCHFGNANATDAFCRHLCSPVGSLPDGGDNGCKAGETCFPFTWNNASQTKSTNIGFCDTLCSGSPC